MFKAMLRGCRKIVKIVLKNMFIVNLYTSVKNSRRNIIQMPLER